MLFQSWLLVVSRDRAIDFITLRAANRAQANANHIAAVFRQMDLILLDVRGHLDPATLRSDLQTAQPERFSAIHAMLQDRLARIAGLAHLRIIDTDGRCICSSEPSLPPGSIAERIDFQRQAAATGDELELSPPLKRRLNQHFGIYGSRRITTDDGAFAGIVLAAFDSDALARRMKAIDQQQWTLALISHDLRLAARQPEQIESIGQTIDSTESDWLRGNAPSFRGPGFGDPEAHIWNHADVEDLPFTVVAGYPEQLALAQWRRDVQAHLLAAALLAAGAVAILMLQARSERAATRTAHLDQRLRSSERALADLVQRVPVGVFRVLLGPDDATIMYTSARCQEILGPTSKPSDVLALIHDTDRPSLRRAMAEAVACGKFIWIGRVTVDGVPRWLEVHATAQETTQAGRLWNGVLQDISHRREAEAALHRQQELMLAMFNNAPVGIALTDPENGKISFVNPAACRILGRSIDTLIGCDPASITRSEDSGIARAAIDRARLPAAPAQQLTVRAITGDGIAIELELLTTAIADEASAQPISLILFQDVGERRRMEAQLRQSEKMQAVGLLAGGIAHDFNNILSGISGFAELARRRHPPEPVASHLDQIVAAADRAKTLVQQILTFSKGVPGDRGPVHLQSTVREVLNLLRATLPSSVEMIVDLSPDVRPVLADPGRIHQVVMNLCGNAVQAMTDQGELHIALDQITLTTAQHGRLGTLRPGIYARLIVRDNGCGMDERTLERIFEPFYTTKGPQAGTGLGLAVVWGVVESHGGDIQVESTPGRSTTFRILLPTIAKPSSETAAVAASDDLPSGTEHILVVDDEPSLRLILGELFQDLGYQVTACSTGREALALLQRQPCTIDLLITDQTMPGMTGSELADTAQDLLPDLPVILCSGLEHVSHKNLDGQRVRHFCTKPVNIQHLTQLARRLLDARPPRT
jgi:PAS domain S-box-containing protein